MYTVFLPPPWAFPQWHINTWEAFFNACKIFSSLDFSIPIITFNSILNVILSWKREWCIPLNFFLIWGLFDQSVWNTSCQFPEDWTQKHFHHALLVKQPRNLEFKREEVDLTSWEESQRIWGLYFKTCKKKKNVYLIFMKYVSFLIWEDIYGEAVYLAP